MDLGSKQEGREMFGCREKFVRETSRERERERTRLPFSIVARV